MAHVDLRAKREGRPTEPHVIEWSETLTLTLPPKLGFDVIDTMSADDVSMVDALELLLGDQFEAWKTEADDAVEDIRLLVEAIDECYGITVGESEASGTD